jgi:hydroxymethylglutaryl-CoA lyase
VLVPNLRGAEAALAAGAHKLTVPFSASETHSLKNVRRTHAQMLDEVRAIVALISAKPAAQRPTFEGSLSTAFGCTYEGAVSADKVVRLAEQLHEAGCDEVGLSDSVGYANPAQIRDLVVRVRDAIGEEAFAGLHLHNTRGLGLANVVAGLEVGVDTFDSSMAGIGGCPFAPGATGNIVTEDLVFMLESMGLRTGIDLTKLLDARTILAAAVPNEQLYGYLPAAGLPLGYGVREAAS